MDNDEWLANQFEDNRGHLRAVAYRMLGSTTEADDAVQEAWLRLSGSDTTTINNLGGWLTTVVSRVCLDMLRSRTSRREAPLGHDDRDMSDLVAGRDNGTDPEQQALLADSVGLALMVVLDTLTPAERVAFVLHDMFAVPFDQIAPVVARSPNATKMLASRARRRVRTAQTVPDSDHIRQRNVVKAFLAAAREGDFDALLQLLDPDVVLRADLATVEAARSKKAHGAPDLANELRGRAAVADIFSGRAHAARPALVNGAPGAVWAPRGQPSSVFTFTITEDKISAVELISDHSRIQRLNLDLLHH